MCFHTNVLIKKSFTFCRNNMHINYVSLAKRVCASTVDSISHESVNRIMTHWLWHTSISESCGSKLPLNESHVAGLLLAQVFAKRGLSSLYDTLDLVLVGENKVHPGIVVSTKTVGEMTLRELTDTVNSIQIQWRHVLYDECLREGRDDSFASLLSILLQSFIRFGELSMQPGTSHVLDDVSSVTVCGVGNLYILTNGYVRRMTNVFQILIRHVELFRMCNFLDEDAVDVNLPQTSCREKILEFLVEASLDKFYEMSMFSDLPPAARAVYLHEFSGMYNSISQVVYFHNQQYERQRQIEIEKIRKGDCHVNTLACLLQLYPDIQVIYEDDMGVLCDIDSTRAVAGNVSSWAWIVLPGCVYLRAPDNSIYHAWDIVKLIDTIYTSK